MVSLIALGSNLGDREAQLSQAIGQLEAHAAVDVIRISSFHVTKPLGGPPGQDDFLNAALTVETSLTPRVLLELLLTIEAGLGRTRELHWGPRTIDLDLLLYGDQIIDEPDLQVPHPRMHERRFVLVPAAEIAEDMVHPQLQRAIRDLLADLDHQSATAQERKRAIEYNSFMEVLSTIDDLRIAVARARRASKSIGLVPTMGALHRGHLSLVDAARAECDFIVATIFVNPTQFAAHEDLKKYPRPLAADLAQLREHQVDLTFTPAATAIYLPNHSTTVDVGPLGQLLEGEFRPTHFRGVATIVMKLFHLIPANRAYFGQKDFQQSLVIKQMVADLNVPIEIRVCPTVREADGLAMSSRNAYLSVAERRQAAAISQCLHEAKALVAEGERQCESILERMRKVLLDAGIEQIDYLVLVDPETLENRTVIASSTLAAVAVHVGATRLIDNQLLSV